MVPLIQLHNEFIHLLFYTPKLPAALTILFTKFDIFCEHLLFVLL